MLYDAFPVWLTSQVPAIRPCYTSRTHCPTEPHRPFLLILTFRVAGYPRFAGRLFLGVPWTFRFGPVIKRTRRLAEHLLEHMVDAWVHTAIQMTVDNHSFDR